MARAAWFVRIAHVRAVAILVVGAMPALLGAAAASAAPAPAAREGVQAALHVGYSRPIGGLQTQAALELSTLFDSEVPFSLEVGWRFDPHWLVGAYGGVAGAAIGSTFAAPCSVANCAARAYRVGLLTKVYLVPDGLLDPWLGVGLGYDVAQLDIEARDAAIATTLRGFEGPTLCAGVDVRLSRYLGLGPFLALAPGEYTHRSVETDHYSFDLPILQSEWHAWLSAGLRWVVLP